MALRKSTAARKWGSRVGKLSTPGGTTADRSLREKGFSDLVALSDVN